MTHNGECPTIRNDGQWGMSKIGMMDSDEWQTIRNDRQLGMTPNGGNDRQLWLADN